MKRFGRIISIAVLLVSISELNAQWMKTNFTPDGNTNCIAVSGDNIFVGTSTGGVYRSTNYGADWTQNVNGLPSQYSDIQALVAEGSTIYAAVKYGGVFISVDNGTTWNSASNGLPNSPYATSLAKSGNDIFIGIDGGVFHSSNNGANWTEVNSGMTDTDVRSLYIVDQTIFAGSYTELYKSPISPISWSSANTGMPAGDFARSYAVTNNKVLKIFVGTGSGIYFSENNGDSWIETTGGYSNEIFNTIAATGNNLIAGLASGDGGIIISKDFGASWMEINDGFPQYPYVGNILVNSGDIFASGPDNHSLWKRPLDQILTSVDDNLEVPVNFSLKQNYPNPFNPSTIIHYSIGETGFTTLSIYNLLGEELLSLVNEVQKPGNYQLEFNSYRLGENFTSGIYFYTLTSGNSKATHKMVLMK